MKTQFKPEGYNCVSPYFVIDDPQQLIDLLQTVFDGALQRCFKGEEGNIRHAEVKVMDSVVMLSGATLDYPANNLLLHVYVPDVDTVYHKALKVGCEGIEAPKVQEGDPDKRGMFKDYGGNIWAIGTQTNNDP